MAMKERRDAIIIGGGPAGLTAGLYLKRAGMDALLIEKGPVGGAILQTEQIENYPGFPKGVSGRELMQRMADQAREFGLDIMDFTPVSGITAQSEGFIVTAGDSTFQATSVIVTTGTEATKLGIPGEREFQGRGVSYCATCDGFFFTDEDVAVIGGGDAAIEEGLTLANIVRHVYVIHRRDSLRAQKILQERVFRNERVEILWNKKPVRISGDEGVQSISLEDTITHEVTELPVSAVFLYVGSHADTDFLGNLVERDPSGYICSTDDLSTRTTGLFVAGDVRQKGLRQVSTAVGDGAVAAVSAERYILLRR
jgi:thioredoxin reductase (NADPH)